ncbi:hypothetical protein [Vibrio phage vB_VibM_83AMN]|nr:hypothetical protein [Vibrio phage vB_VibM_83AMN]
MKFIYAYLIVIVAVNLGFSYLPMINTPLGVVPLMSLFVGLVFILRDYAQRSAKHKVLWAMAIGCVLSWLFGEPGVVYASVTAFACSELMDWLIYSITKKPFHKRVLISSLCSVPVDSIVFLGMIGVFNPGAMLAMSLSKFTASGILWIIYHYNLIPNLRKTA